MFVKNNAARLITVSVIINGVTQDFPILPGENPAVEIPDAAAKLDFVKALIENGSLIETVAPKAEVEEKSARKERETKE